MLILFAKESCVGFYQFIHIFHDGARPVKMSFAVFHCNLVVEAIKVKNLGSDVATINFGSRWGENEYVFANFLNSGNVFVQSTRIFFQILQIIELGWVHENAYNHPI